MRLRVLLIWSVLCLGAITSASFAQAPRNDEKVDLALWRGLRQANTELEVADPAQAVALYGQFLRAAAGAKPALHPSIAIDAWSSLIQLAHKAMKDADTALKLCDEALALYQAHPRGTALLMEKARILALEGRNAQVQTLVQESWEKIIQAPPLHSRTIMWQLWSALKTPDKRDELIRVLQGMMLQAPGFLDEEEQATNAWMYRFLIDNLLATGRADEALSWAKLRWMECAFDDKTMTVATDMLVRVWGKQDAAQKPQNALQEFARAQSALPVGEGQNIAPKANPLAAVALPRLDAPMLQAHLTRLASQAGGWQHEQKTHRRINLLILAGDWTRAMTEARRLWMELPESPAGVKEITRVYKARDLNLIRANAFLRWLQKSEGTNPLDEFFKEQEGAA